MPTTPQHKRSILITGCSTGGLGAALAEAFHETGRWRVVASARNVKKLEGIRGFDPTALNLNDDGGRAVSWTKGEEAIQGLKLDICDDESIKLAVETTRSLVNGHGEGEDEGAGEGEGKGLDALCLNAGGGLSMPITDLTPHALQHVFNLNVFRQIATLNAFLPLLLQARTRLAATGLKPTVVVHTSAAAHPYGNLPFLAGYNASKAAMGHFTEAMRMELGILGIDVVELRTGLVSSNFYENLGKVSGEAPRPVLPEGSLWNVKGVRELVERAMDKSGEMDGSGSDRTEWARGVVRDVERRKKVVYRGDKAKLVLWSGWILPKALYDVIMKRFLGIQDVDRMLKQAEEEAKAGKPNVGT